ncbi:MAG: aminoglycoside phosphotransferase (APT) family kinase protein [Planctomycetota bacterium]|jgi:aminoglycoside phosphotransferase (APT) family kinase protein
MKPYAPAPLELGALLPYIARLESGEDFKEVFEALLLDLPLPIADHLGLIMREGRGSWLPLLRSSAGRVLFVGSALSGTVHVLAAIGFKPHIYEVSEERMRFEVFRCEALTGVTCEWTLADDSERLPFEDDEFDVVIQESGAPAHPDGWSHDFKELRRVCSGELIVTANNRMGYKRSLGKRGQFAVPSPLRFAREVLRSPGGERTLIGYRRELSFKECAQPSAFSLYPVSADFTHVVAIDAPTPRLHIGPKERDNRLKIIGHKLGLFPWLTPSFAIISSKQDLHNKCEPRLQRIVKELAERTGEALPQIDELIASRGNCIVLQTRAASGDLRQEQGRWCVHIALSPHKHVQVERHYRVIEKLWQREASVPVPEPLYFGTIEGLTLSCERRMSGFAAPQLSGNSACMRRLLDDTAQHFANLVCDAPRTVDEQLFHELFDWRFEIVSSHAGRLETQKNLQKMRAEVREMIIGEKLPLVLQHADLRNKHVQVDGEGKALAYLDWGSSRDNDVPYFDLLQLIVHEHKQAHGGYIGEAWKQVLLENRCQDWERQALDAYAKAIGLSPQVARALELCFPVFVAAMAESNWDYSRPRWVHHSFGI